MADDKKQSKAQKQSQDDAGQAEVQERFDAEAEKGLSGEEVDPIPNERYSIKSGPESPTALEQVKAAADIDAPRRFPGLVEEGR